MQHQRFEQSGSKATNIAGSFVFLTALILIFNSCRKHHFYNQINAFPEVSFGKHWTLRIPAGIKEPNTRDVYFEDIFIFPNDSMTMKSSVDSISPEDALSNFKFVVRNEMNNVSYGPCLGGFEGYAKYFNFLDIPKGLSGYILDLEENGKRSVAIMIEHFRSGSQLNLYFESLSPETQELVHTIIKNVRFTP